MRLNSDTFRKERYSSKNLPLETKTRINCLVKIKHCLKFSYLTFLFLKKRNKIQNTMKLKRY